MTTIDSVPRALREVWEWKEQIAQEVAGLPLAQALQRTLDKAAAAARELAPGNHGNPDSKAVAENRKPYHVS